MSARALFRVRTTSCSGAEPHENAAAWSEEIQLSSRSFPWGRRTWAQPSRIRRPRRGLGVWVAVRRGTLGWKLVGDTLLRSSGRGGRGGRKGQLRHQRVFWALPESVHFAAARTCGRGLRGSWESQSSPGDRQGRSWGPRAIPGRKSGGHFGTPGGLPGCTFGSSEHDFRSAGRLQRLKFGLQTPRSAR